MAAAGCIDVPVAEVVGITVTGISGVGDLSKNEITQVNQYIELLKSKKN